MMSDEIEQTTDVSEFEGWWLNNLDGCPSHQDAWDAAETLWRQKDEVRQEIMDAVVKDADKAYELLRWAETEMRYAGWGTRINDQHGRIDVYEAIVGFLK